MQRARALELNDVQVSQAGSYQVTILGPASATNSAVATLDVIQAAMVFAQPLSQDTWPGSNVTFSVTSIGNGSLAYQWFVDGSEIPDATDANYAIANVQPMHAGDYAVRLTDAVGTILSSVAHLAVHTHPVFTLEPVDRTVAVATSPINVPLAASAFSSTPVRYQWLRDGATITDATNATYVITNAQPEDSGSYAVMASDDYGSTTSSNALLSVVVRPSILSDPTPANQVVSVGEPISLTISAAGSVPIAYRWRHNGSGTNILFDGGTNTLIVPDAQLSDAGFYDVLLTNIGGPGVPSVSHRAYVTVMEPLPNQLAVAGGNATFSFAACTYYPAVNLSSYALKYAWWFNETNLLASNTSNIRTLSDIPLTITNVQATNEGTYTVVATNLAGTVLTQSATLTLVTILITNQPLSQTVVEGSAVTFSVGAEGAGPFTYQWQRDGSSLLGETNTTLMLTNVQAGHAGGYRAVVTGVGDGVTSDTAQLVVITPENLRLENVMVPANPNDPVTLGFAGSVGMSYTVKYRDDLDVGPWQTLTNIPPLGISQPVIIFDGGAGGQPQRFYRIIAPMEP